MCTRYLDTIDPRAPCSFYDHVRNIQFLDVAGSSQIAAYQQYQQPPDAFFRPSAVPAPRLPMNGSPMVGAAHDGSQYFNLRTDEGRCLSYAATPYSLRNYLLRM